MATKKGARRPAGERAGAAESSPRRSGRRLIVMGSAFAGLVLMIAVYLWWGGGARPFRGNTSSYNVLLITLDTTRADHLGCYGYGQIRTPILDGLADRAVLFENAYTPAVMTLPSHVTILTGLLPPAHGVRNNGSHRLLPATETLAEVLRAAGLRTGAVIGSFVLDSMFGLDQGFDSYDDYLPDTGSHDIFFAERNASEVTDAALRFIGEAKAGRWFLWVHYFDPHSPLKPPSPYREQYAQRRYDGEIAYMDAEIGRLLGGVEETGAGGRTIVVAVGDHGEGLRDHGEQSHGVFLYDETARVPLIVAVPGFAEEPRRVRAVVRTTDIMPTILDLLRLPPRPASHGTSLWPLIQGQTEDLGLAAFGEATVPLLMYGWSPLASLREEDWKFIQAPEPEIYNLAADPKERTNLLPAEQERAAAMGRRLESILDGAAGAGRGAEEVAASPEDLARLRSLGYVGGGAPAGRGLLAGEPRVLLEGKARGLADPKHRVAQLEQINQVYLAYGAGDFVTAVERARTILAEDPENANVRQYMADSLRSMRRFDEAMSEYRTLLAADPGNVDALLNVGWVLMNQERFGEATAAFERALQIHPEHTYALASLGNLHFVQDDYDGAIPYYRQVLLQRPNHRQSILAMAKIFEKRGQVHEAKVFYKRAAELDPRDIDTRLSLGWIQFASEEFEEALKTLDEAAAIDPNLPELDLYRGDIYLAMGRLSEAEGAYRKGIAEAPGAPHGYHGLGMIAASQGDLPLARRLFEQALRADPSFGPSRRELQRLGGSRPPGG